MMRVLVTGGAGYIGSHAVMALREKGHHVIVVDDLSTGFKRSVAEDVPFYVCSLHDHDVIYGVLKKERVDAVMHFAAFSLVAESVADPLKYYHNNVEGSRALVSAMLKASVHTLIFSSSAAVYGETEVQPITEDVPLKPKNPYGETKRAIETMLEHVSAVTPLNYVALRYFNVAGAHESGLIGENHTPETHLIPNLLKASSGEDDTFTLYGTDHPTPDGTAVRDYVHVEDLVEAHILALNHAVKHCVSDVFNLGTAKGYSVRNILEKTKTVTGKDFKVSCVDKRPGDPAVLVASYEKAKRILGWSPSRDLEAMIVSADRYFTKAGLK